jgi:hypothetical protein
VWSFLQPSLGTLELHAAYTTGTISSSSTTVTLTTGTWPSWAASGELWADDVWHTIASRSSDSQIVLDTAPTTAFSSDTFSLQHREYALPDDFGGMNEPFSYRKDQYSPWQALIKINEAMIRGMEGEPEVADWPAYFAIVTIAPTTTSEQKRAALFYPMTSATRQLWYRYVAEPSTAIDGTTVYAYGDAQYMDLLRLSCLDVALQTLYSDNSKHEAFERSLAAAVSHDRRMNRPSTLGFGSYSDGYDRGHGVDLNEIHRNTTIASMSGLI